MPVAQLRALIGRHEKIRNDFKEQKADKCRVKSNSKNYRFNKLKKTKK